MLFKFDIKDMKKIYDHATKNPNKTMEPSFIFAVDDNGVYITSNGQRGEGTAAELDLLIYAQNCNSKKNENWLDIRIALKADTGERGDDFAEIISCYWLDMILELDSEREFLVLEITADQIILILEEDQL